METMSVAVKLQDSADGMGLVEATGLLTISEDSLRIQFRSQDAIFGVFKSKLKTTEIPLSKVEELGYKKSIFGNKLFFKVTDLQLIESLPGCNNNKVTLGVSREDITTAEDMVRAVRLDMSEREYQAAMGE